MLPGDRHGIGVAFFGWVVSYSLLLCALSACLIPPPGDELPPIENRPPRIITTSLSPGLSTGPVSINSACPDEFAAAVTDTEGDVLFWRVFLDYHRNLPGARSPAVTSIALDLPDQAVEVRFPVDGTEFALGNPHTVELIVADRAFSEDREDPEGRVLVDENGFTDSFIWTVVLDDTLPCEGGL